MVGRDKAALGPKDRQVARQIERMEQDMPCNLF